MEICIVKIEPNVLLSLASPITSITTCDKYSAKSNKCSTKSNKYSTKSIYRQSVTTQKCGTFIEYIIKRHIVAINDTKVWHIPTNSNKYSAKSNKCSTKSIYRHLKGNFEDFAHFVGIN